MASTNHPNENIITFDSGRNRTGDPYVSELLKGLVDSFKDLERKNRDLEKRNAELLYVLQQANEKIAKLEKYPAANPELSKMALKAAVEILESAEEAAGAVRLAAKAQASDRYRDTTGRLLELQRQMASLLEATREENARRDQEATEKALSIILGSRDSILSMAEDLDIASSESKISHIPSTKTNPESLVMSPHDLVASDQLSGSSQQEAAPSAQSSEPRTQKPTQDPGLKTQDSTTTLAQTVELIASPFRSFGDLYSFQQAVQKLTGVIEVKAQSFAKGTLRLRIKRRCIIPLVTQLAELPDFSFELVFQTKNSIEINLIW